MERGELIEAVARVVWERRAASGCSPSHMDRGIAAAAIRVVLAEAQQSIEALPRFEGGGLLRSNGAWVSRRDALAVLAALVPPPPV